MRSIVVALGFFLLYLAVAQAILSSDFEVISEDADITYYSYLRESSLQDSGYTRGLKTGAFDYLVKDPKNKSIAIITNKMRYDYGKTDETGMFVGVENSSVENKHTVDFRGEKGISEFYGKGFFKNNRAISAWKKIRYDDVENWNLGPTYLSDYIKVDASLRMDMEPGMDYDFQYKADVANGIAEIKDSAGWSNKTGSRMIDWEQDALMKGKVLSIKNDLMDQDFNPPAAGLPNEWLPCCFSPPRAMTLQRGEVWPNKDQIMLLDCSCPWPGTATASPYNSQYVSSEKGSATSGATSSTDDAVDGSEPLEEGAAIQAKKYLLKTEPSTSNPSKNYSALYIFEIKNIGEARLAETEATDTLPAKMSFISSQCWRAIEETPGETLNFELKKCKNTYSQPREDGSSDITWDLGNLELDETIRIYFWTEYELGADPLKNKGMAEGKFQGQNYQNLVEEVSKDIRDTDFAEDFLKYAPKQSL